MKPSGVNAIICMLLLWQLVVVQEVSDVSNRKIPSFVESFICIFRQNIQKPNIFKYGITDVLSAEKVYKCLSFVYT
jgi:hypothetical protein